MNMWTLLTPALVLLLCFKYLLLQAFFYERKLGMVWMGAFVLVTASTVFPEGVSTVVAIIASLIYFIFFLMFVAKYYRQAFVYIPLIIISITLFVLLALGWFIFNGGGLNAL